MTKTAKWTLGVIWTLCVSIVICVWLEWHTASLILSFIQLLACLAAAFQPKPGELTDD